MPIVVYQLLIVIISARGGTNTYLLIPAVWFCLCFSTKSNPSYQLLLGAPASNRSFSSPGALNTDWDGEGGAKNRLKEAVDSFRLEGLVVDGVRLGAV